MDHNHSDKKAKEYFQQAMERMQSLEIAPTPVMYELWYVYCSGENPALSHAVEMAENDGALSEVECLKLHQEYLSHDRRINVVQEAGEQIQTTIRDVNDLVSDVSDLTGKYSDTLNEVTDRLEGHDYTQEEIQGFLAGIAEDTKTILEKNTNLESELAKQAEAMAELQGDLDRAQREMMLDSLTNIANRKAFDQKVSALVEEARADEEASFSMIFMDIDHFKAFNDQYGHQVGDQVLRLVARTLIDGLKGQDFVARYGGEEFVILLPHTNQHGAQRVGDNLREAVAAKEVINRGTGRSMGRITLSGGVTEFYNEDTVDDMIERADEALYMAKNKGRNMICQAKITVARNK